MNTTINGTQQNDLDVKANLDWIWSIIVSMFPVGAIFGALLSGLVAEKFGRLANT